MKMEGFRACRRQRTPFLITFPTTQVGIEARISIVIEDLKPLFPTGEVGS